MVMFVAYGLTDVNQMVLVHATDSLIKHRAV